MTTNNNTIIFFDTETTGLNPEIDKIISIFAKKYIIDTGPHHFRLKYVDTIDIVVDPETEIPENVTKINGFFRDKENLSPMNVYGLEAISEYVEDIESFFMGSICVAHNISFDTRFLQKNVSKRLFHKVACTKIVYAKILGIHPTFEYIPNTSLDKLCDFLEISRSHRKIHTASIDVELLYECFLKIIFSNNLDDIVFDADIIPDLYN